MICFICYRHIREHLSEYYKDEDLDKLDLSTVEAAQFHYFKLHDTDGNKKLDGLELYAALDHFSDHHPQHDEREPVVFDHSQIVESVDRALEDGDLDEDGFIDYYEFIKGQEIAKKKMEEMRNKRS